jgi:membrane-associated phospholipid phosphatase
MIKNIRTLFAGLALLSVELLIILVLFVCSLFAFAFILNEVFWRKDTNFDNTVFVSMRPFITDFNTRLMRGITFFGAGEFLLPANIILALYFLFLRKHKWYSLRVPVVSIGSFIMMASLKIYFSRSRPEDPVYQVARGFSFPSGHAMSAMTFYGLIIFLVWKNVSNRTLKWILTILLIIFILLIGFSRIYLRVHYASDVLAGFSLGLIWLVLSLWVMHKVENYTRKEIAPEINTAP